jgi:thiamine kinase-like enzyme
MSALNTTIAIETFEEIQALSCFSSKSCSVESLTGGESHLCFKVTVNKGSLENHYFVKSLADHQATAKAETASNLLAAQAGLAPAIIYHSPLWLVCEFIAGESLSSFDAESMPHVSISKMMIAMNLMVKTHQLKPSNDHQILDIKGLLVSQKNQPHVTPLQHVALNITISKIVPKQARYADLVLCHGDVNYGNIRLSDTFRKDYALEKTWLVDYECSYLAEVEYDIAMFIAVNELGTDDVDSVIRSYQKYVEMNITDHAKHIVDKEKVRGYLACCYLINGLWYFEVANERKQSQDIMIKARQQFESFDQLALLEEKVAPLF